MRATRRSMVAAVAVVAMTGAMFAFASSSPASDPAALSVSGGVPVCNPATGEYGITWTVTNTLGSVVDSGVFKAQMTPPGTELAALYGVYAVGEQKSALGTVPGTTTGSVQLLVDYRLSAPTVYHATGTVDLPGTCVATPAALPVLQVGPSAALPGEAVTISGTACLIPIQGSAFGTAQPGGTVTGSVAFTPPLVFGPITAAADGTWSTSIVVPAGTPPGEYAVSASCAFPVADGANAVIFDGVPASVHGQAAPAGFAYETKYLTVALVAAPRTTG